jgi:hypothetical protein
MHDDGEEEVLYMTMCLYDYVQSTRHSEQQHVHDAEVGIDCETGPRRRGKSARRM